jgi:hypothetical protein
MERVFLLLIIIGILPLGISKRADESNITCADVDAIRRLARTDDGREPQSLALPRQSLRLSLAAARSCSPELVG